MKTNQSKTLVALLIATGASVILLIRWDQPNETGVNPITDSHKAHERPIDSILPEPRHEALKVLMDWHNQPVTLYGKVVDQFGEPVVAATVEISLYPVNIPNGKGSDGGLRTDHEGKFSISGLTGTSIGASAMKEGYLRVPPLSSFSSSASLDYTGGYGTGDHHADPSNPVVLKLLKVVPEGPMIHVGKKRWKLPLDGTPTVIALDSEDGEGIHQIEFRLWSNTHIRELPGNNAYSSFDWSFEIRVPGGGVAWDESDVRFEAPATGYKDVVRYEYPATMAREKWKRFQKGRYFVRFADDTYGRIQFDIDGGSDRRPLYMESWLSLTPGSRNLATEHMVINVMESEEPASP
jgi:hypothetical protein